MQVKKVRITNNNHHKEFAFKFVEDKKDSEVA